MSSELFQRVYDRFDDVTRVAMAPVPLTITTSDADWFTLSFAMRYDIPGNHQPPYPEAEGPEDGGGRAKLFLIVANTGRHWFREKVPLVLLIDESIRFRPTCMVRREDARGLGGERTESLVYQVGHDVLCALARAYLIEARVDRTEVEVPTAGRAFFSAFLGALTAVGTSEPPQGSVESRATAPETPVRLGPARKLEWFDLRCDDEEYRRLATSPVRPQGFEWYAEVVDAEEGMHILVCRGNRCFRNIPFGDGMSVEDAVEMAERELLLLMDDAAQRDRRAKGLVGRKGASRYTQHGDMAVGEYLRSRGW